MDADAHGADIADSSFHAGCSSWRKCQADMLLSVEGGTLSQYAEFAHARKK
ncbi:MAG: hypothetical protein IKR81_04450 [Victivallales bacterium]|nr:hypothetical protein [Victivallales bacterium]